MILMIFITFRFQSASMDDEQIIRALFEEEGTGSDYHDGSDSEEEDLVEVQEERYYTEQDDDDEDTMELGGEELQRSREFYLGK